MPATVLIGGDVCPIGRNRDLFRRGDADALLNDLRPDFAGADLTIVNLECPLVRGDSPKPKVGPSLGAPVECVEGLKAIGVDLVGLANNHLMDHGAEGLRSTVRALEECGIDYVGAGLNLEAAREIWIREIGGVRIGLLAVAEREFGIAGRTTPGVNPLDLIDLVRNIRSRRRDFDFLIVLLHGGNQLYPYPRPGLRDTCRFIIEEGADVVLCQHSHCAGCREDYRGGLIVYGQGDFLFDRSEHSEKLDAGLLLKIEVRGGGDFKADLIPFLQLQDIGGARRMDAAGESAFLGDFDRRSAEILIPGFLESEFEKFCRHLQRYYLNTLHGRPSLLRKVAGRLGMLYYLDRPKICRERLNLIRCESHREALLELLSRGEARKDYREGLNGGG